MKYLVILFLVLVFSGCQEKEKYIYKYENNGSIPISRMLISTGVVELYSNEYFIEREITGIEYTKELLNDKTLNKLNDEDFIKAVYEKFYKDMDFNEIKRKITEKKHKVYDLKKENYRWIDINEHTKQRKLYDESLSKRFK